MQNSSAKIYALNLLNFNGEYWSFAVQNTLSVFRRT